MKEAAPADGQALCTRCGLCCTGALHDRASLDEDEVGQAKAIGLDVVENAAPAFRLGCPKLSGTMCGIYPDRPRVCGRYACRLLSDLQDGDCSLDEALTHVGEARRLHADLLGVMSPGMRMADARQTLTLNAAYEEAQATLMLRAAALALYLDMHFRNEKEGPIMIALDPPALGNAA